MSDDIIQQIAADLTESQKRAVLSAHPTSYGLTIRRLSICDVPRDLRLIVGGDPSYQVLNDIGTRVFKELEERAKK